MRPLALLVLIVGLVVPSGTATAALSQDDRDEVRAVLAVLHDWDDRRAVAWARADETELRSLYVPGSAAGRADVRLLGAYTARGFVVRRMEVQVFGVRLLHRSGQRIVVSVLDRMAGGVVEQDGQEQPLPSSRPVVRRIELVLVGEDWLVDSVTGWG